MFPFQAEADSSIVSVGSSYPHTGSSDTRPSRPGDRLPANRIIDLLIEEARSGAVRPELYDDAANLLRRQRLSPRRAALAEQRLQNARRYAYHQEFGLAAFELRMIRPLIA